ncbi:hypothetical protein [Allobranchiibius sp. GilTou73]|uniref:hypothetical protein n=1 Tax=Allobranchiibius sp. GilTou73 TaxID=2904523 RepID=UPI001F36AB06|nr:hypothetical protein [Allobranchiibius sp. GilTou73]UIJ36076.1 hypothetical protein LVQ62_06800 [Allobranchiibius sp. GilTou73]
MSSAEGRACQCVTIPEMAVVWAPVASRIRPIAKGASASRVTRNALYAARRAFSPLAVVADEQVGAPAHQLPADDGEQHVVGQHHQLHGGGEEAHGGGEPGVPRVLAQIPAGDQLDDERDQRDGDGEQHGEPVDAEPHRRLQHPPQRQCADGAAGPLGRAAQLLHHQRRSRDQAEERAEQGDDERGHAGPAHQHQGEAGGQGRQQDDQLRGVHRPAAAVGQRVDHRSSSPATVTSMSPRER